jgi:O-succinylbenzoic acid--CoA ligase
VDWLQRSAHRAPDAPALIAEGRTWSFGVLDRAASAAAAALVRNGVRPAERVAFSGERSASAAIAAWGIPRAGATAVVLDPGLAPAEAMRRTRDLGVRAVWHPLGEGWLARSGDIEFPGSGPPDSGARYVVFTSGTGGPARGVEVTGQMVSASAAASEDRLRNGPDDRWLCVLPLHHVGGLSILWRSARAGGAVVLEERFDAARSARLMRDGQVTLASLVPTMLRRVLEADPGPYRGLRAVLVGGGPLDPELVAAAVAAGMPALETYGTTETASQIATTPPEEAGMYPGGTGPPLDGIEVRIVGVDGRPLPPGTTGRIQVRGAVVTPGYLDGEAIPAGSWLPTGDLGTLDRHGRLYVSGRADDVIVTGGENVVPAVVEEALAGHPGVVDVRVSGEDDPEWGRAVVAEIVLAAGIQLVEVIDWARRRLAPHQVPKRWHTSAEIDRGWKQPSAP